MITIQREIVVKNQKEFCEELNKMREFIKNTACLQ